MKSATFVHACFGATASPPAARSDRASGASTETSAGGELPTISTVVSVGSSARRTSSASIRRAVGRIAQVERRDRRARHDVVGNACLEPRDRHDLEERQAVDDGFAPLVRHHTRQAVDRAVDGVVGEPGARGMAASPLEHDTCGDVPDAPRLDLEVGGLEEHRQVGVADERTAVEERGERIEPRW